MKRNLKRISGIFLASSMLFASSVYAAGGGGTGTGTPDTSIMAGVFASGDKVRIDVQVPTTFSFVVQVDDKTASEDLAPTVLAPTAQVIPGTGGNLVLGSTGTTNLQMTNRSSRQRGGTGAWAGLDVQLTGVIDDNPANAAAGFTYNGSLTTVNAAAALNLPAKSYGITIESVTPGGAGKIEHKFNRPVMGSGQGLDVPISLPAPTVNTVDGTSTADSQVPFKLDIGVGGKNKDYKVAGAYQSQASSNVGNIKWTVSYTP